MLKTTAAFLEACDEKGLYYNEPAELPSGMDAVVCPVNGSHGNTYDVLFFFDPDEASVAVRAGILTRCTRDTLARMLLTVNRLNNRFRWYKFVLDEDGDVWLECDAVLNPDTAGAVGTELMLRAMRIAGKAYPALAEVSSLPAVGE